MTDRSGEDWDRIQGRVEAFEKLWRRGQRPRIADHLPEGPAHRFEVLVELVHADLEFRLKAGEDARVEDYLAPYPELRESRAILLDLIRTEWTVRKRRDRGLKFDRYRVRFPELADDLKLGPAEGSTIADVGPPGPVEPMPTVVGDGGSLPRRLGKYELRQRVGAGSFGIVYRAWDTVLRREVAVKVPKAEALASPGDVRVFLREARNAIHLRHQNIVTVHDAGPIDGIECVVRAFIEGGTLAERLLEGPIEPEKAAELMVSVAGALEHAHENGIVHRDLKPANILLDLDGRPHLADFGLARREAGDSTLSPTGAVGPVIGTPAYMSPEQARGEASLVDARSDVYSAGVVLYEMLTGTTPFRGRGRLLQVQIEAAEPTPLRSLNEDVPADLESICLTALAKSPDDRYPSASALAVDLKNFLDGRPIVPRPGATPERKRWRWPGAARSAIVAAILLVGLAAWLAVAARSRRSDDARRLGEALGALREVAALPYQEGLDGPEAHRRAMDLAWARTLDLARRLGDHPGLERPTAEVLVEVARRASDAGSDRRTIGAWGEAIRAVEVVLARHPDDLAASADLATGLAELARIEARAGRGDQAKTLRARALGLSREVREARATSLASRPAEVGPMLDLAEAILAEDGIARESGEPAEIQIAESLAREVADRPGLGSVDRRRLARLWLDLARRDRELGQPRRAISVIRQVLSLPIDEPMAAELARARLTLGLASRDLGQGVEAIESFGAAARAYEALIVAEPMVDDHARDLATAEFEAGLLVETLGRHDEAMAAFGRVVRAREALRGRHPDLASEASRLGEAWTAIGSTLDRQGRPVLAASAFVKAGLEDLRAATLAPGERAHRSAMATHARAASRMLTNRR